MLAEGRGGFIDFGKFRERLTDIVWHGKMPELTEEERAEAAKRMTGGPPPMDALEEARALYQASKERQASPADEPTPTAPPMDPLEEARAMYEASKQRLAAKKN